MTAAHVPLQKDKPKPKPKTCSGSETGDVIGSVTAHLGLAAAGIISPPGVQCGTGAADLALTVGEETGVVCGGSLKTESPVWRGVNLGLASAGAAVSCVPVVGNIFNAGKTVYTAGELAVRGVGEGVSKAVGWFTSLFRPRVTAKAVSTGIELVEHTAASTSHVAATVSTAASKTVSLPGSAAKVALVPGSITRATVSVGGRVAKATAPSVLVRGEKAVVEAVEAGGKGSARAVAHVVEEAPIRPPPPRPPRPPVGVPMTAAMRAHLLAEIGSVVGQVVAPDLGIGNVSKTQGKEEDVLLPGAVGVIAMYILGKRYNLF
jgi:hypothetical protein